nr:unnamed protein product [Spirometra erinaceieuropaei]
MVLAIPSILIQLPLLKRRLRRAPANGPLRDGPTHIIISTVANRGDRGLREDSPSRRLLAYTPMTTALSREESSPKGGFKLSNSMGPSWSAGVLGEAKVLDMSLKLKSPARMLAVDSSQRGLGSPMPPFLGWTTTETPLTPPLDMLSSSKNMTAAAAAAVSTATALATAMGLRSSISSVYSPTPRQTFFTAPLATASSPSGSSTVRSPPGVQKAKYTWKSDVGEAGGQKRALTPASPSSMNEVEEATAELVDNHLWKRFHAYGTEMVITKSGRGVLNRSSTISDTAIARLTQVATDADLDFPPHLHELAETLQQ